MSANKDILFSRINSPRPSRNQLHVLEAMDCQLLSCCQHCIRIWQRFCRFRLWALCAALSTNLRNSLEVRSYSPSDIVVDFIACASKPCCAFSPEEPSIYFHHYSLSPSAKCHRSTPRTTCALIMLCPINGFSAVMITSPRGKRCLLGKVGARTSSCRAVAHRAHHMMCFLVHGTRSPGWRIGASHRSPATSFARNIAASMAVTVESVNRRMVIRPCTKPVPKWVNARCAGWTYRSALFRIQLTRHSTDADCDGAANIAAHNGAVTLRGLAAGIPEWHAPLVRRSLPSAKRNAAGYSSQDHPHLVIQAFFTQPTDAVRKPRSPSQSCQPRRYTDSRWTLSIETSLMARTNTDLQAAG